MSKNFVSDIAFSAEVKKRQEEMGSRKTYQKMAERRDWQDEINDSLRSFISLRDSFYMASVNANGQPYIQHRGGPKGFLKILDKKHLAFADYSGNRQYISVGNFDTNTKVHLFLMDYPNRMRIKIWGEIVTHEPNNPLLQQVLDENYTAEVERIIKIKVNAWDINCPQHIEQRFTTEEFQPRVKQLENKIIELEKQLKELQK
ncbi:pyridoxamine 5'-phosphate oxidase family protein [Aquimarina sp. MMG015]|uniref:pyridoxamine 5'-phosphate oxidase family protein n=1 Tax=Aquimarina TaxID=290174 RepID=UPI00042569D8|nr:MULTISPECIES: pyridoxamine 5'-phosphate oxidase family protein [Aquimarina]AXT54516.1 pyridoxamine 5'-phosphate oxidase [Aquimarina sp. AD1]MBQ4804634.1 pyridoxamine 5'-phosphate oxidase family protein [Aquimarina sp. MMG015]RKN20205.1 pyridoxamine 5'-phosphate oxidase [Aquimarina sp. AD1]